MTRSERSKTWLTDILLEAEQRIEKRVNQIVTEQNIREVANNSSEFMYGYKSGFDDGVKSQRKPLVFGPEADTSRTATGVSLSISEAECNTPCTAKLEVKLQKLAAYFEKRAKENRRREEKHEASAKSCREGHYLKTAEVVEQHGYYFSGKADSYTRAAQKLRELLGETWIDFDPEKFKAIKAEPEQWTVEREFPVGGWRQSTNVNVRGTFASKRLAEVAIEKDKLRTSTTMRYRATRVS